MMRLRSAGAATALLLFLSGPAAFAQDYSAGIASTYRVRANVTYVKSGAWEGKVDIYSRRDAGPQPTLIWIHGGPQTAVTKDGQLFSLMPYLEAGWNVVNLDHRLPGVTFAPAALQNTWCALRFIAQNASMYGFDTSKVVIAGASSGAWFAVTGAMTPRPAHWDGACPGDEDVEVAAVVDWYGNWDFADILQGPNEKDYALGWVESFSDPLAIARAMRPVFDASSPPTISIHGDADPVVPYSQSVRLQDALKEAHVAAELVTIAGGGHGGFSRAENQRAYAAIEAFLKNQGLWPTE
jgi:acetyl esterase/lipase